MNEKRDWRGYIDVTAIEPETLIRNAYELSKPQGLGFLHAKDGPLSDDEISAIMERYAGRKVIHTDYVNGRAMKFSINTDPDTNSRYIGSKWYDHSEWHVLELLRMSGHPEPEAALARANAENEILAAEYEAELERE